MCIYIYIYICIHRAIVKLICIVKVTYKVICIVIFRVLSMIDSTSRGLTAGWGEIAAAVLLGYNNKYYTYYCYHYQYY